MPSRDRPPASTVPAASARASRARWAAEGFSSPRGSTAGSRGPARRRRRRGAGRGGQGRGTRRWRRGRGGGRRGSGTAPAGPPRPRLCREPKIGGITHKRPTAGMRVPHPEQRVALTLHQMLVPDPGPVVRRGMQQGPAGGVTAEGKRIGGRGHGPNPDLGVLTADTVDMDAQHTLPTRPGADPRTRRARGRPATGGSGPRHRAERQRALRGQRPVVRLPPGRGSLRARTGPRIAEPPPRPRRTRHPEGDVEEARPGDDDVADPVGVEKPGT